MILCVTSCCSHMILCVTSCCGHMILCVTSCCCSSLQIVMGIAYSVLACALWPLVAYIVPEHQLGTAYGL